MLLYVVCFLRMGVVCCVVIFVLSVIRVVGGVTLWVVCVFRPVDVVCLCLVHPVAILSVVFCVICSLFIFVSDDIPLHYCAHRQGDGLIAHVKDDMAFTDINIPKAIGAHGTELQLVKIHMDKTGHIAVANACFPPNF